jgi:ABC-type taurine transport system substrate-binding protein
MSRGFDEHGWGICPHCDVYGRMHWAVDDRANRVVRLEPMDPAAYIQRGPIGCLDCWERALRGEDE